jgi:Mrp family chromosome partitioning ATPase
VNLKAIKNCQNNGITIYPIVVNDIYFEGKRKKNYVKIEINVNGAKKLGSDKYKQDETLTNKVHELYEVLNLKLV